MRITLTNKPQGSDATHLKVEVKYSLGGVNWFNGKEEKRGIRLHVSPIKYEPGSNGNWGVETSMLGSGTKFLLEETKRDNVKKTNAYRDRLAKEVEAKEGALWDNIMLFANKYGFEVETPEMTNTFEATSEVAAG